MREGKKEMGFEDGCCIGCAEVAVDFRPGKNDLLCSLVVLAPTHKGT